MQGGLHGCPAPTQQHLRRAAHVTAAVRASSAVVACVRKAESVRCFESNQLACPISDSFSQYACRSLQHVHIISLRSAMLEAASVVFSTQAFVGYLDIGVRPLIPLEPDQFRDIVVRAHKKYNRTGVLLQEGAEYIFSIPDGQKWYDASIECGPGGWDRAGVQLGFTEVTILGMEPFRRVRKANWFEIIGSIGDNDSELFRILQHLQEGNPYIPKSNGELCAFANDLNRLYGNNSGRIKLTVKRVK